MTSAATPSILIVGAGFGGIAMALELKRHGHENFTILEKGTDVGGVWRENTYPGAACDIPSVLYSYSFAPNPRWASRFAGQADIQRYIRDVASKFGVDKHIRFSVEVSSARFDADRAVWQVTTTDGETLEADVFVPAVGQLSRPALPQITGMKSFAGASFHSAEWDHSVDLEGKRVAVIGTGASAIQIVPSIQPEVEHLTLFQRSAPYMIPKLDAEFSPLHHRVFELVPAVQLAERAAWAGFFQVVTMGLGGSGPIAGFMGRWARWHRDRQVTDPQLRAKLTPDYPVGCKRGLMSSDYYPAVGQPNVTVETGKITKITRGGVVTSDGVEHPVDVIVYCTGFTATDFLAPMDIEGLGGKNLREIWSEGARAYYGMAVPHFPNMFVMYGPNTNLGAGSIIYMHEKQAGYIRQAVQFLAAHGGFVDVRTEVEDTFDAEIQQRLAHTVWAGCTSWYRDATGRVSTNWPGLVTEYAKRTRVFKASDYETVTATAS